MKEDVFRFNIEDFPVGKKVLKDITFPSFYGLQKVTSPLYVYRATKKISPCVVVTSCIHGDEINGLSISQSMMRKSISLKRGTLIIIPVVNIYGFLNKSRYLPDRKDLNRSFPGTATGSFGPRFSKFIIDNFGRIGDVYLDLHSGGTGRFNIPQIRTDFNTKGLKSILKKVEIPLVVNSSLQDGTFRETITDLGKTCLVFEGGEGLRIDPKVTQLGTRFVRSILEHYKMVKPSIKTQQVEKIFINQTKWIRATEGGILFNKFKLGKIVNKDEVVGEIRTNSGKLIDKITSEGTGVILGMNRHPLIMAGDALYNLGFIGKKPVPLPDEIFDWGDF